ncbi:MAG TPA: hypothetical protein VD838_22785, partial [Anaeromyxobacteraceae bacterium]|nr:hypothetical protein [Anaeromyxobacteraceae bacterium]
MRRGTARGGTGFPAPFAARRPRGALREVDGRVVLLLALLFGVLVWSAGLVPNGLYAAFFAAVLAAAGTARHEALRLARWAASFALAWGGVKLAIDLAGGVPLAPAVDGVLLLCVRLVALLLLGAAVSVLLSPHALGLALATLTRPVLRERAWTAALALLLMVHFVPRALAEFRGARAALRLRRI